MSREKLISSLQQIQALAQACLEQLDGSPKPKEFLKSSSSASTLAGPLAIDFDKPLRPFIKQYAGSLSGPGKFVLLLSGLVKGDLKNEVALDEIQRHWNKMKAKSLLGLTFNRFYPAQARENDWVETTKPGFYRLRPSWKEALGKSVR